MARGLSCFRKFGLLLVALCLNGIFHGFQIDDQWYRGTLEQSALSALPWDAGIHHGVGPVQGSVSQEETPTNVITTISIPGGVPVTVSPEETKHYVTTSGSNPEVEPVQPPPKDTQTNVTTTSSIHGVEPVRQSPEAAQQNTTTSSSGPGDEPVPVSPEKTKKNVATTTTTAGTPGGEQVPVSLEETQTNGTTDDSTPPTTDTTNRSLAYPLPGQTRPYYSNRERLAELIQIGPHILNCTSGCQMAVWFVPVSPKIANSGSDDCPFTDPVKRLTESNIHQVQAYDTIYVPFATARDFVLKLLPNVTVPVVVLSGQNNNVPPFSQWIVDRLLNNDHVLAWFCQNVPKYGGQDLNHTKLKPFPYGVNRAHIYKTVLMEFPDDETLYKFKSRTIYNGPMRTSISSRSSIQRPPKRIPSDVYFREMARSYYVISPDGDRPECFRHYEAIGLGAIPITELKPDFFRHLQPGPVIYGNKHWNVTQLESESIYWWDNITHESATTTTTTTTTKTVIPKTNRNMVFQEYWMEFVDWEVGFGLRWWNEETGQPMVVASLFQQSPADTQASVAISSIIAGGDPVPALLDETPQNGTTNATATTSTPGGDNALPKSRKEMQTDVTTVDSIPPMIDTTNRSLAYPLPGQTRPYYSDRDRLSELIQIGPHILNCTSGCQMAVWFVPVSPKIANSGSDDCPYTDPIKRLTESNIHQVQAYDTIYVPFSTAYDFVVTLLPKVTVPIVVLSGQNNNVPPFAQWIVNRFLNNDHVLAWFCQNVPKYGGQDLNHTKLKPFPYGVNRAHIYKTVLMEFPDDETLYKFKSRTIYNGPMRTSISSRSSIQRPIQRIPSDVYFREMARSYYVISPDGDRPECFRHYEAIGLGAIPITELKPDFFRHLQPGPVIYGNTHWNVTQLESESLYWWNNTTHESATTTTTTTTTKTVIPKTNRNMVFQEYWMEFVDWEVGFGLRWWNVETGQPMVISSLFQQQFIV